MEDYKKKYEQAMLRMNKWVEGSEITDPKEVAEFVFPELRESEDEKIRNEIIYYLDREITLSNFGGDIATFRKWIAWLEKIDPKKHEEELERAYKCADEVQYRKGYEDAKKELEKQGEQTPTKVVKSISVFDLTWEDINTLEDLMAHVHYEFRNGISAEGFGKEVLEQFLLNKDIPEESEVKESELPNGEDYGIDSLYHAERILEKTLGEVEGYQSDDGILEHKCAIEAVKRLYKQKPTWSEEDEGTLNSILNDLSQNVIPDEEDIQWLKSLNARMKGE